MFGKLILVSITGGESSDTVVRLKIFWTIDSPNTVLAIIIPAL